MYVCIIDLESYLKVGTTTQHVLSCCFEKGHCFGEIPLVRLEGRRRATDAAWAFELLPESALEESS